MVFEFWLNCSYSSHRSLGATLIRVNQLCKKFELADPAKLQQQEQQDPRLKGRFFYSLQDVSFHCARGQVLGLLGPNGAGKTTTLRILSTALTANSGEIYIDDEDLTFKPCNSPK